MDCDGALIIGEGMSNTVHHFNASSNVLLGIGGDAYAHGTVYALGIAGISNQMDCHASFLSNVGSMQSSNITVENLNVMIVNADFITSKNLDIPGLGITSTELVATLDKFAHTGKVAVFSTSSSNLPAQLTSQSIYTDENQGKMQIMAPLSEFGTGINTAAFTNLLKLEGPSPAIVLRNTRTDAYDGQLSSSTLQFNYEKSAGITLRGALKFTDGMFFLEHDRSIICATQRGHFNVLNGAFGVFEKDANTRVSYFNFNDHVEDVSSVTSKLLITRGVQIRGDLYVDTINGGFGKLTVQGDAEINGSAKISNLEVSGKLTARNSVLQWSDSNLKTDIQPITHALDKVMSMQGHSFILKDAHDDMREVGLVAQEVALVVPEVVRQSSNGNLAVAYGNLAGIFVEAIKELTNKVNSLTATVSELQAEVKKLKNI